MKKKIKIISVIGALGLSFFAGKALSIEWFRAQEIGAFGEHGKVYRFSQEGATCWVVETYLPFSPESSSSSISCVRWK